MPQARTHHSHPDHESTVKKRFARIRGQRRVLDVADDNHWAVMRGEPKPKLVCPIDGCTQELVTVFLSDHETRYLRYNNPNDSKGCPHLEVPPSGGGPMTEEHLWLQITFYNYCIELGFEAYLETDFADIRVESDPPFALEVQRHDTDFDKRSAQRAEKGMKTLWLLPDSARRAVNDPLFNRPAVRVKYIREGDTSRPPWDPQCRGRTTITVGATIWERDFDPSRLTPAGNQNPKEFLREVLDGERGWYTRSALHGARTEQRTWAGWALTRDFVAVRSERTRRELLASASLMEEENRRRQIDLRDCIRRDYVQARRLNEDRFQAAELRASDHYHLNSTPPGER
ncbi:hypothetical protein ACTXJ3_12950 [Brachybacterium paraconglomeratum]|uniref:hypothetical protein n=1 Tax=Brachybacterium paraconglomeratum TaxID=173362 RepID=UPI003FD167D4